MWRRVEKLKEEKNRNKTKKVKSGGEKNRKKNDDF